MPRMMGAAAYDGLFCHCCNQPRSHHHQRQRERQQWRRAEWQQADQRNIWSGDARRPDYDPYSLVEEYLVFGYWVVESEEAMS